MILRVVVLGALLCGAVDVFADQTIRSVRVQGNARTPAALVLRHVSAAPGKPYAPTATHADLKELHALGLFEDVQVQGLEVGEDLVDVIYRVREHPFVASFRVEGVDSKLQEQILEHLEKEKRGLRPATPFNPAAGTRAASAVRDYLRSRRYANANVRITTQRRGGAVDVICVIESGDRMKIGAVRFAGVDSVSQKELLRQMKFARPARFWERWSVPSRYIPEELHADLARIKQYYLSRGFAAMTVGAPVVQQTTVKGQPRIEIEIPVVEGARYRLASVRVDGRLRAGADDVNRMVSGLKTPSEYDCSLLESTRQGIVDVLGHHGYALARVELAQSLNEADRTVQAIYRVTIGDPVQIGRVRFSGNKRIPDKFLRRELRVQEGEIYDAALLDKSVARLNRSNLLKELRRSDVALKMNEETGLLDITFSIKEKDRQGIYATGGTGGIGGGYLGILYTAFNFLRIGESLSLEFDGGASQSNLLLNIVGTRFLGSPFTIALSVFNKYAGFNVANVVPGPEDLIGVLRKRSRGVGLTGAYPVTDALQLGLGFEARRDSITDLSSAQSVTSASLKSEVAPFVVYDRTTGRGSDLRGYAVGYSHALNGSLFLKSLDSMRQSVQYTHYVDDPFSNGRNSFVFHVQGSRVRPHGGGDLLLERRFYPGDESIRGFSRGSLSPWAMVPSGAGYSLQAAGADTVLGFSTEYRVPIKGPVSGVGFFDLGWSRLNPKGAAQLGTGARLIEGANGVLRASLGGELRVQLPMINQPARMIFSWNPLRLNTLFGAGASPLRLIEPKTSFRFALGSLF